MLILEGSRAFSDFNKKKLLNSLQVSLTGLSDIHARYWHFVKIKEDLSKDELIQLKELLHYGESDEDGRPYGELLLVTPRPGTISPWSSKATDIIHNCGLDKVARVERGIAYFIEYKDDFTQLTTDQRFFIKGKIHDRMIEVVLEHEDDAEVLFNQAEPKPLRRVDLGNNAIAALERANIDLGLALSDDEIEYLAKNYAKLKRNPTDVELMMFAQANSEHCRHKIFNADWIIDGKKQDQTLFGMIKNTYKQSPEGVLSAYHDNASVVEGPAATKFFPNSETQEYGYEKEAVHMLMKVETHNHPTAISPFPGAATGSGGEIRDEGATGNGSKPKAGLCGFSVSNLKIPDYEMPWENQFGKPSRIDSALDIMLEGPIGAAAFNNEFGRPNLTGYFRCFEAEVPGATTNTSGKELRGYHKPIMLAGGLGNIRPNNIDMKEIPVKTPIVVLGGPAMLIGLGGGAASSMASGTSAESLDFASVQRGNPEMERRAQEVIDRCVAMGDNNPILWIHDVGAGGISNAIPEIVNDAGRGGKFELRDVPNDEPGMAPMEIWCNEAQERYVLAIDKDKLDSFKALCERERAIYAVVGHATEEKHLQVHDDLFENNPVDMSMDMLLGKPPKMTRNVNHKNFHKPALDLSEIVLEEAIERVLRLPTVASKSFLITIGDRSITGMVNRDQMVGPWQVPVADVAVTCSDYKAYNGEAMALGERTPIALVNPAASGRMAIGESITNIAAAKISKISDIFLSANWMAAAGHEGEDASLFDTVKAVGEELCPELGIAIPVGKDSLSMKTVWDQNTADGVIKREMTAPLSLITTAFAIVEDVRLTLSPQLRRDKGETELILIDLGKGKNRLAASALAQVYSQVGDDAPDIDDASALINFFKTIQKLNGEDKILAYHDRSDGGLLATLTEMAFAGRTGISVSLDKLGASAIDSLFNEELGAVIQVRQTELTDVLAAFSENNLSDHTHVIGTLNATDEINFTLSGKDVYTERRSVLQQIWAETSYRMQALRDNDECAAQEFERLSDEYNEGEDQGLTATTTFDIAEDISAPYINTGAKPAIAILREQGVNGQQEMAVAFDRANFKAVDVHMTDVISGKVSLADYKGIVACGGFSYGDVLGAGGGWAKTILHNPRAKDEFTAFFNREDVFGLGVCNGCQMFSHLRDLIPGASHWPEFYRNKSEQFEGRAVMVEILESPSILFKEMQGTKIPIAVAHGEGRAVFTGDSSAESALEKNIVSVRYIDNSGEPTMHYPENPNGAEMGITGLCSTDGRFTIMMPHPERVIRTVTNSWHPDIWEEDSPWMRMFRNARVWID